MASLNNLMEVTKSPWLYRVCNKWDNIRISQGKAILPKKFMSKDMLDALGFKVVDCDAKTFVSNGAKWATKWIATTEDTAIAFDALTSDGHHDVKDVHDDDDCLIVIDPKILDHDAYNVHGYQEYQKKEAYTNFKTKLFSEKDKEVDFCGRIPVEAYKAITKKQLLDAYPVMLKKFQQEGRPMGEDDRNVKVATIHYCLSQL